MSRETRPESQQPRNREERGNGEQMAGTGGFDHLPFGVPVPGKPGFVTLAGKHGNLPEIDVRGIASGTPVEIPDPENSGSTIRFRVP